MDERHWEMQLEFCHISMRSRHGLFQQHESQQVLHPAEARLVGLSGVPIGRARKEPLEQSKFASCLEFIGGGISYGEKRQRVHRLSKVAIYPVLEAPLT